MKTAMRFAYLSVLGLAVGSVLGCATARIYSGPPLPPDQVAYLERGDLSQSLHSIDGREGGNFFQNNRRIEILPGEHTVVVGYGRFTRPLGAQYIESTQPVALTFIAKPGARYILKSNVDGMRWFPAIVEKE